MSRSGPRQRAVFRLPWVSVVFPFLLFICVTPLATFRPWLLWLYVIPVLALVYVVVTRTVADATSIATRGLAGHRRIRWDDLDGFEFQGPRWALAVTQAGGRIRLPMVRPRDLPVLAEVSGGRLTLGTPVPAETSGAEATDFPNAVDTSAVDTHAVDSDITGIGVADSAGDPEPVGRSESSDVRIPAVLGAAASVETSSASATAAGSVDQQGEPVDTVAGPAAPGL